jgi:hypothetical protein
VARAKSQPGRKVIDGVEYFSAQAAADVLGRSYRTLTRLEKAGSFDTPTRSRARTRRPGGTHNKTWKSFAGWWSSQGLVIAKLVVADNSSRC